MSVVTITCFLLRNLVLEHVRRVYIQCEILPITQHLFVSLCVQSMQTTLPLLLVCSLVPMTLVSETERAFNKLMAAKRESFSIKTQ